MTIEPKYPTEYDGELDISQIKKHNWKTADSRDRWIESLNKVDRAWPNVEILGVADDDNPRQLAIIERARLRSKDTINCISEHGLCVETTQNAAFISTDQDIADMGPDYWEENDWRKLGELFGYPSCCIDAYRTVDPINLPIYEIACRSGNATALDDDNQTILLDEPNGLLNIIWKYMGWQFISHTPCSFDCEESIEIAQKSGGYYRELGLDDESEDLWEFLSTPVTWTGYHGLSNIRNGYLIGSTNTPEYWDKKTVVWKEEHAKKLL